MDAIIWNQLVALIVTPCVELWSNPETAGKIFVQK
jgi:hypothetical protein